MVKLLADLGPGEGGEIVSLLGGRGVQFRLRALGLREGQFITKLSCLVWGGPVIILVNRAQVAVGLGMARRILVRVWKRGKGEQGPEK